MNSYEKLFVTLTEAGLSPAAAAERVFNTYLDGRPRRRGVVKSNFAELDAMMWDSSYLSSLPAEVWQTQAAILALTRYMHSTQLNNPPLLAHLAKLAPAPVRKAIRYSGLALHDNPLRRGEIARLAELLPHEFGEITRTLTIIKNIRHERLGVVEQCKAPLAGLSPLEMLIYASLYACEHLLPQPTRGEGARKDGLEIQAGWKAINDLLTWKLATADARTLLLREADIVNSLRIHLLPFINPSAADPAREDLYRAFQQLLAAQMKLNSFSDDSDAFSYDDTITLASRGNELKIGEVDFAARQVWQRNGERLMRLHEYWYYRALEKYRESRMALETPDASETQQANRVAWVKALRTWLQLDEVYGMNAAVLTDSGVAVDLFQALLAQELMTQYFDIAFMQPYLQLYTDSHDARAALFQLMKSGLQQPGMHNLMPLTFSDRQTKIDKIVSWTASAEFPHGSSAAAEAILDFWTNDWTLLAKKLKTGRAELNPELFERPVLRMGSWLFQLPCLVAEQDNASAAINNLRRIGARRLQAREETHRIERRLAKYLDARGFKTETNYVPPRTGGKAAGEVDIICAGEGHVIVMEVKSTFLRRSVKDAWLHKFTTLRKAGLQLERKLEAMRAALQTDAALQRTLGLVGDTDAISLRGWIVDTSIEHDHERFNGFLKMSLEELLIALRDDARYLRDPDGLFRPAQQADGHSRGEHSLYPAGFSAARFIEVIENDVVWANSGRQS